MCFGAIVIVVDGVSSLASAMPQSSYLDLIKPPNVKSFLPVVGPLVGGTVVTVIGSGFKVNGEVYFNLLDGAGLVTGDRVACQWRDVPGMSYNDTAVVYVPLHSVMSVCDVVFAVDLRVAVPSPFWVAACTWTVVISAATCSGSFR